MAEMLTHTHKHKHRTKRKFPHFRKTDSVRQNYVFSLTFLSHFSKSVQKSFGKKRCWLLSIFADVLNVVNVTNVVNVSNVVNLSSLIFVVKNFVVDRRSAVVRVWSCGMSRRRRRWWRVGSWVWELGSSGCDVIVVFFVIDIVVNFNVVFKVVFLVVVAFFDDVDFSD